MSTQKVQTQTTPANPDHLLPSDPRPLVAAIAHRLGWTSYLLRTLRNDYPEGDGRRVDIDTELAEIAAFMRGEETAKIYQEYETLRLVAASVYQTSVVNLKEAYERVVAMQTALEGLEPEWEHLSGLPGLPNLR